MKRYFSFLIAFLFFYNYSSAQDTVLTFFNRDQEPVKKKKKDGYYVMKISSNGVKSFLLYCSDPFLRSVASSQMNGLQEDGSFTLYSYAGSKLKEGRILAGCRVGEWNEWYRDGSKRAALTYLADTAEVKRLLLTSSVPKLQLHENSLLIGSNIWYHRNGRVAAKEIYDEKGALLYASTWKSDGTPMQEKVSLEKYGNQQMSYFTGGTSKGSAGLKEFLIENIKYPESAYKEKVQGQAIIEFTIDDEGGVSDIKVKKSSGNRSLDTEATRVVDKMNGLWEPAKVHNVPISTYYMLPVTFRL